MPQRFMSDAHHCRPAHEFSFHVPVGRDFWVFAYGSLIWDPGFPFVEHHLGLLKGYHRQFCIYSHQYRGTPERPGLVFGLDRGGSCHGVIFRVAASDVPQTLEYLWLREMDGRVYQPKLLPVRCGRGHVMALAFVVDRTHPHYCGRLDVKRAAEIICCAVGRRGPNIDYLVNTVEHLDHLGIPDCSLHVLLDETRRQSEDPTFA
ncbi:Gamma-glutamylcyclotransferase [Azospirillaceae bacterium]